MTSYVKIIGTLSSTPPYDWEAERAFSEEPTAKIINLSEVRQQKTIVESKRINNSLVVNTLGKTALNHEVQ